MVKVYDCCFQGKLLKSVQKQAAAILRTQAPEIIFSVECVQQVSATEKSGVFSLAFLVDLCLELIQLKQSMMKYN